MDDYTAARFADAYERPYPEDHPRCEDCGERLTDDEIESCKGPLSSVDICDQCGSVCDCCDTKVWLEDIAFSGQRIGARGIAIGQEVNVCIQCIEELDDEEINEFVSAI